MPLLVDTYNVLHVVGVLPPDLAGLDTRGLGEAIGHSRYRREPTTLVCDGVPPDDPPLRSVGPVRIRYAGNRPGRLTADDLIIASVNRSSHPRRLIVVSSDRQILRAARRRRCRTLTSEEFLHQIAADIEAAQPPAAAPARPTAGLSGSQVEEWTEIFEIDEQATSRLAPPPSPAEDPAAPGPAVEAARARAEADARAREQALFDALPPGLIEEAESLLAELEAESRAEADAQAAAAAPETPETEETPTAPPDPGTALEPDGGDVRDPRASLFPEGLLDEAEAIMREMAVPAPAPAPASEIPEPASELPVTEKPKTRGLGAVLPEDLVAEAEALAGHHTAAAPDRAPAEPDEQSRNVPSMPSMPSISSPPPPVLDVPLPPDILDEAERLWRSGTDDDGDEAETPDDRS